MNGQYPLLDLDACQRRQERLRVRMAESSLDAATQASGSAAASLAHWNARVEVLREALETARSRAGLQHLADVDGVVGALLDFVDQAGNELVQFVKALFQA